jgi:hypothetical protein
MVIASAQTISFHGFGIGDAFGQRGIRAFD